MTSGLVVNWLGKVPMSIVGVVWLEWGAYGAWLGIATEMALIATIGLLRIQGSAWLGHAEPTEDADAPAAARAAAAA
jgi:Na+-driven multidrug efflux pump